ncbi:hypothetical protein ACFQE5_01440 [Pseudonocardia hispaniensis]|uniref:Alpha/beta hydrolase family protein n=1 Tax=Pseudonocardia hispaniensis TaxID=904933 RepID=A0ABW1IWR7_9PSEU
MIGWPAQVRLDSDWFVLGTATSAVLLSALVPARWRRWHHRRAGRTMSVVAAVTSVVLASGAAVNGIGSFYPTLGALAGTSTLPAGEPPHSTPARGGPGSVRTLRLPQGPRVGVYLPAAYADPDFAGTRFPVVLWLGDEPLRRSGLPALLDEAIAAHRLPPVVVLATGPDADPAAVGHWARRVLRVRTDRSAWSVAAPPGGPACPLDVALRHPADYASAAGPPCNPPGPSGPAAPTALLATARAGHPGEIAALERARAAAAPLAQLTGYVLPGTAAAQRRAVLGWLGAQLPGPVLGGGDGVPA